MDKKFVKPTEEERKAILQKLADAIPDIERMEQQAEMLRIMWMSKRRALRRAEEQESKAKAGYFNSHEALVLARASTLLGQATTFGTKKETSDDNRRDHADNIPPMP